MIINQSLGGINVTDALLTQYPISSESRTIVPGNFIKFVEDNGIVYVEKSLGVDVDLGTQYIKLDERNILVNSSIASARIIKIDDTRILAVYTYIDSNAYYQTEGMIIKLEDGSFSYGTPLKFLSATSPNSVYVASYDVALLDNDNFLFAYTRYGTNYQISGIVGVINGLDITFPGVTYVISSTNSTTLAKVWYAGNNVAWLAYGDTITETSGLRVKSIEVNGTILTEKTQSTGRIANFVNSVNSFVPFGNNKQMVLFYNKSSVQAFFITTDGTNATFSTPVTVYNSTMNGSLSLCRLTDTTCIAVISDPRGLAIPITVDISTNTITASSTTYAFYSYASYNVSISPISSTSAIITYIDANEGNQKYYARVVNYNSSNNSLTFGNNLTVGSAITGINIATHFINDTSIFLFKAIINSSLGLGFVTLSPSESDPNTLIEGMEITTYGDGVIDGIARSGGEPGDTIYIYTLEGTMESALEAMTANTFVQTL